MKLCPYCKVQLTRVPRRRAACPSCRQPICVRKRQLYTVEEARALDWCSRLLITESRFRRCRQELSAEFGQPASFGDTAWRLMQEAVLRASDWHERKMLYFQMARFLWEEHKDHLDSRRQSVRMQLEDWKEKAATGLLDLDRTRLAVATAREASCPQCRQLEGRRFTFDEATSDTPVPVADCTHEKKEGVKRGWCRCEYVLSFD